MLESGEDVKKGIGSKFHFFYLRGKIKEKRTYFNVYALRVYLLTSNYEYIHV